MRWIKEEGQFRETFLKARTCVYIDSGREITSLKRLIFDDAMLLSNAFAGMLQMLLKWSEDVNCRYIVLDPDPVHYFYRHFTKYPVLEIARGDQPNTLIRALNEDPGGSPADAIGINCMAWVIVPPSIHWFMHALRDSGDSGGHLWVPTEWVAEIVKNFAFIRDEAMSVS